MSGLEAALFALGLGALVGGADLLVRGAAGIARRLGISPLVVGLTVVALACLPIFFTGSVVTRSEGVLLLAYYVAYVLYLVLAAGHSPMAAPFGRAVVLVAVAITAIAFAMLAARSWRRPRRQAR